MKNQRISTSQLRQQMIFVKAGYDQKNSNRLPEKNQISSDVIFDTISKDTTFNNNRSLQLPII